MKKKSASKNLLSFFLKKILNKIFSFFPRTKEGILVACSKLDFEGWQRFYLVMVWLHYFCLQPSAKDQGITRVVVVLLVLVLVLHLVHFFIKRNLREKNSPQTGYKPGTSRSTVWLSTNWAKETLLLKWLQIIYLFQKSRHRPWTSIGRHLFP